MDKRILVTPQKAQLCITGQNTVDYLFTVKDTPSAESVALRSTPGGSCRKDKYPHLSLAFDS